MGCKGRSGAYSISWELRKWRQFLFILVWPRANHIHTTTWKCLDTYLPLSRARMKICALSGKHRCEYSLSSRVIMKMKTFLVYRNQGSGSHSKTIHMREGSANTEEKMHGHLRQRNIFRCFQLWLRIGKKMFNKSLYSKALSENIPSILFIFLNNDISKRPLYNHKKIKTLQGMILAV